jgi:hypothetical protein
MDAARMKEILKKEYGICSMEELDRAMQESPGINLGIFTMPIPGKEEINGDIKRVC